MNYCQQCGIDATTESFLDGKYCSFACAYDRMDELEKALKDVQELQDRLSLPCSRSEGA